jgi:HEAT repeat protein
MSQIILRRSRVRPDDVDDLLPLTMDPDPKTRAEAVRALCPCHVKGHDQRIWDRIFELVRDEDVDVRRQVFHALGDGSPRALETQVVSSFEAFLDDPDERLRRRARKLLASYRRTGKINVL